MFIIKRLKFLCSVLNQPVTLPSKAFSPIQ